MATKNMIVRIGADLSDLKGKTQQAKSLFEKMTTVRSSAARTAKTTLPRSWNVPGQRWPGWKATISA